MNFSIKKKPVKKAIKPKLSIFEDADKAVVESAPAVQFLDKLDKQTLKPVDKSIKALSIPLANTSEKNEASGETTAPIPLLSRSKPNLEAKETTLDAYERIPVESFGAAMLRGMGWKGEENDSNDETIKARPHLLGIGARPSVLIDNRANKRLKVMEDAIKARKEQEESEKK